MHRRRNGDLRMADHRDLIARHHGQAQRAGLGLGRRGAGGHDPARAARDQFAGGGDHLVQRAQLAADQQLQLEMIGRHAVGMRHQQVAVLRDQALVHVQPVVAVAHDRIDMHLDVGPGGAQRRQPARQRVRLGRLAQVAADHGPRHARHAPVFQTLQQAVEPIHGHGPAVQRRIVRRVAQDHGGHGQRAPAGLAEHRHGGVVADAAIDDLGLMEMMSTWTVAAGSAAPGVGAAEVAVMLQAPRGTDRGSPPAGGVRLF